MAAIRWLHTPVNRTRIIIVVIGIILPYVLRMAPGAPPIEQYTDTTIHDILMFSAFNAIAWGSIVALSFLYRRPEPLLMPCAFGFGFLTWQRAALDLASDAQASIALIFIPVYALLPIALGGALGYMLDRRLNVPPLLYDCQGS